MNNTTIQMQDLRNAIASLPLHPDGWMLDDIHYGPGKDVLSNEEYFKAKLTDDGVSPDGAHLLFTSVLKAWNDRIEAAQS